MICAICGAPCVQFDAGKWTHKGVEFTSVSFRHKPIPVEGA